MEYSFVELMTFFVVVILLFMMIKLDGRIKGMKYTLDQIANKIQIPEKPINDELRKLIEAGNDTKAIKLARETLGFSLVEAKQYVDGLKRDRK